MPTIIGQKVYDEFQEIWNKLNHWYVVNQQSKLEEQIHVNCSSSVSNTILNQVVLPFSQKYTNIDVVLHNQYVSEIFTTIKKSTVNIAFTSILQLKEEQFMYQAQNLGLKIYNLFSGKRCLLLGATHSWAERDTLKQRDLKGLSLATYSAMHDGPTAIYAPYFKNVYKMATKENIMEIVVKNKAVFLPVFELIKDDFLWSVILLKYIQFQLQILTIRFRLLLFPLKYSQEASSCFLTNE